MKKTYKKPHVYFESFQLSQSIAAGCMGIANFDENSCSVYIPDLGWVIFQDQLNGCQLTGPDVNDMVCYHAPSDSNNVFSS